VSHQRRTMVKPSRFISDVHCHAETGPRLYVEGAKIRSFEDNFEPTQRAALSWPDAGRRPAFEGELGSKIQAPGGSNGV
jgi:hypothetical protein